MREYLKTMLTKQFEHEGIKYDKEIRLTHQMEKTLAFKKLQKLCTTYTENKRIDTEIVIIWRLFVFIEALKGSIIVGPRINIESNIRDNDDNIILLPSYTLTRDKKNVENILKIMINVVMIKVKILKIVI